MADPKSSTFRVNWKRKAEVLLRENDLLRKALANQPKERTKNAVERVAKTLAERYTPGVWSKRSKDARWQNWRETYMKDARVVIAALRGSE